MAQPSDAPLSSPVSVIGSQFIAPYQFDIIVDIISSGNLVITDMNNKIMLKVKPCDARFHHQRFLLDADDKPIAVIREKITSIHHRWNVFRGKSKSKSDIIFTTQTPNMIQVKTNLDVFLTKNRDVCDFKIKGSWSNTNCTIYIGDTSTAIAQMSKMKSSENVQLVEGKFKVTIYPNVDYAFVVTLIAIVEAMKIISSDISSKVAFEVGSNLGGIVAAALII